MRTDCPEQSRDFSAVSGAYTAIAVVTLLLTLVLSGLIFLAQARAARLEIAKHRRFRYRDTDKLVEIEPIGDDHYHLFLSHAWVTAQDQMRVIKQRLGESLPGLKTFLDVDDLASQGGKGAELVARAQVMLLFGSDGYFGGLHPPSRPCIMELVACHAAKKPIITMLEVEDKHRLRTPHQLYEQMRKLDEPIHDSHPSGGRSEQLPEHA